MSLSLSLFIFSQTATRWFTKCVLVYNLIAAAAQVVGRLAAGSRQGRVINGVRAMRETGRCPSPR